MNAPMTRAWAMPHRSTFSIGPIAQLIGGGDAMSLTGKARLDSHDVAVVMATGALLVSAAAATYGLLALGFLAALKAENTWRTRNQAIVKGMKP